MATLWGRFSMATTAAYSTFRRVWSDPQSIVARNQFAAQVATYDYRWHLYQNSVFDDKATWAQYRHKYGLYRYIRPIYNPVRRLVDFYTGIVYPGRLATDGKRLPDGTPLAIPLAADINPQLREAIGQLWQWSNWQTGKNLYVRYGAALGDVAVEVVDEVDRGKVTFDILWPGLIADLELDSTGNVKRYVIEYDAEDDTGKAYVYRKEVDSERIAEYKDNELYRYDESIDAERANPYGFAPLVWCKHTDLGGEHGSPAVRNVGKIDELNEIASHAHDRAHAVLSSPILVAGEGVQALTAEQTEAKRVATQEMSNPTAGRESVRILKANSGAMSTVQLPEGEALNYIAKLLEEIENDHKELQMYNELRQMSQVTGPAAERLIGDAIAYVEEARSNYDTQSVKLFQMSIAIAGWRANTGAWGRALNRQQQAFLPFDLDSYERGDLDFEVMPRPILPAIERTPDEQRVLMEQAERGFATRAKTIEKLGGDPETDMAEIDQEQASQQDANADTVQRVMERVRGTVSNNQPDVNRNQETLPNI
jgi:hypothetical protein